MLGSAEVALNGSGSATASVLYGPYGSPRYSSGTMPGSYGFTGQHSDTVTGLDDYGARYYDPSISQFASADSVAAGGLNHYAYVGGNPETKADPTGLLACLPNSTICLPPPTRHRGGGTPLPQQQPPTPQTPPAPHKTMVMVAAHACGASLECQYQTRCNATCQRLGDIQALRAYFEHVADRIKLFGIFLADVTTAGLDFLNLLTDLSAPAGGIGIWADVMGLIADATEAIDVGIQLFAGENSQVARQWELVAGVLHWIASGAHFLASIAGALNWLGLGFLDNLRNQAERKVKDLITNIAMHLLTTGVHFGLGLADIADYEDRLNGESLGQLQQECATFNAC